MKFRGQKGRETNTKSQENVDSICPANFLFFPFLDSSSFMASSSNTTKIPLLFYFFFFSLQKVKLINLTVSKVSLFIHTLTQYKTSSFLPPPPFLSTSILSLELHRISFLPSALPTSALFLFSSPKLLLHSWFTFSVLKEVFLVLCVMFSV